ncbi:MAG: metallopeptidase [Pseudonocardiales bacterium]|nr:MAG: metallopeptidase [Pseudonocardiales bacterium]
MTLRNVLRRGVLATVAASTTFGSVVTPAVGDPAHDGSDFHAGAPGAGDPYFPFAGNGGFDVRNYTLLLSYRPRSHQLSGTAVVSALATENLSRFDLDLRRDMAVSSVAVDGHRAHYVRSGKQELVITPQSKLHAGRPFTVVVSYAGRPRPVIDPDGSLDGWIPTDDGAFVAGEPQGSPSWFPGSDHPSDKATFTTIVTVPKGISVVGNGRLVAHASYRDRQTFVWREDKPMATYLSTVSLGRFQVTRSRTPDGIPVYVAVDPRERAASAGVVAQIPAIIDYFERLFGPYPFGSTGAIIDHAHFVGYALETQTRPLFDRAPDAVNLAHELSHQWYGDSVSLTRWKEIWLNEGFASYASWLWSGHSGGPTPQQLFNRIYATPANDSFWKIPPANPGGPAGIFAGPIYARGAMTLQALRVKLGDRVFFQIMRDWAREHRYGNARISAFIRLAEHDSGTNLRSFFDTWLYRPAKPTSW